MGLNSEGDDGLRSGSRSVGDDSGEESEDGRSSTEITPGKDESR
jgi:hypothetical protein